MTRDLKNFWRQNRSHLYAVTPSHWLKGQATKFSWDKTKITTIKNPIPDTFFENKNRSACKEALGIKDDLPAVICIAGNLEEERKGGLFLKQILNTSIVEKVQFLLIGSGFNDCHDNIISLGFIKDELTLKIAYHAADLLLHPAPIDNLPNTVAESISCGTPVLAFETGGIPEMVVEDVSGWLVKSIDTDSMIKKLKTIIESSLYINIRNSCQQFAEDHFNYNEIGSLYIKLFESLHLKSHSTPR